MIIRKAFRYRIYPNAQQKKKLAVQFGHTRFVYNHFLAERQDYYHAHKNDPDKKGLTYVDTNKMLTALKRTKECEWLKEARLPGITGVASVPGSGVSKLLCQTCKISPLQE